MLTVLGFCTEMADGPTWGDTFSGSKAAPGSFSDGGALPLSLKLLSSGGLPMMLP